MILPSGLVSGLYCFGEDGCCGGFLGWGRGRRAEGRKRVFDGVKEYFKILPCIFSMRIYFLARTSYFVV